MEGNLFFISIRYDLNHEEIILRLVIKLFCFHLRLFGKQKIDFLSLTPLKVPLSYPKEESFTHRNKMNLPLCTNPNVRSTTRVYAEATDLKLCDKAEWKPLMSTFLACLKLFFLLFSIIFC